MNPLLSALGLDQYQGPPSLRGLPPELAAQLMPAPGQGPPPAAAQLPPALQAAAAGPQGPSLAQLDGPSPWQMFGGTPPAAGGPIAPGAGPAPAAGPNPAAFLGAEAKGQGNDATPPAFMNTPVNTMNGGAGKPAAGYTPTGDKGGFTPAPAPAPNPFQPGFQDTGGVSGMYNPRYVVTPDEKLAAMAEQVANRTSANLLGTGVNSMTGQVVGMPEMLAAGNQGQQAAGDFLKAAGESQKLQHLGAEGQANRETELQKAGIAGQSHVDAARLTAEAHNNPNVLRGQALANLAANLANNPGTNPATVKELMGFVGGQFGGGGGPAPFAPAVPKGDGSAPPSAAVPDGISNIFSGNQALVNASAPFLQGGKPIESPGIGNADDLLTRLGTASPTDRAAIAEDIRSGKLGDPEKVLASIAQSTARSHFLLQPPTGPDGKPIGRFAQWNQFPGSYAINGEDGQPLFSMKSMGRSPLGAVGTAIAGGGTIPFNRVAVRGGKEFPINPSDLGMMWTTPGSMPSPDVLKTRAGVGAALLDILTRNQAPR